MIISADSLEPGLGTRERRRKKEPASTGLIFMVISVVNRLTRFFRAQLYRNNMYLNNIMDKTEMNELYRFGEEKLYQMGDGVSFYFYKRLNCRGQTIFAFKELIDPWRIQGFGYKTQSRTVVFK